MKKLIVTLVLSALVAFGITGLSATPASLTTQKAEASYLNSCYVDMFGQAWCYRMGCTTLEVWFNGCYTGWVRVNKTWYA